jgi:CBS domain-containing protein
MGTPKDLRKEFPSVSDRAYMEYKRHRKVTEVMSQEIVMITPEASVDEAAKIMGEKHIGSLIVVKYDTPVGIVTERDLLSNVIARGRDPKGVKVETEMSYPLISLCSTVEIREAAQMMIKKKGRLAVFECGKLVGIITASDLIQSLPEAPETKIKVDDFMTKKVITADGKTDVASIAKMMGERRIGSVIITSKGERRGIFTERDLLTTFLAKGKSLKIPVGEACSSPLITAPLGISVHEAAYTMASKHIKRLPLIEDGELVGIITARDLVEAYAK